MGLLHEKGGLGAGKHRAFAVMSESRASDIVLRFFDWCANYKVCMHLTLVALIVWQFDPEILCFLCFKLLEGSELVIEVFKSASSLYLLV